VASCAEAESNDQNELLRFFQSLAKRRHRLNPAMERSTIHRTDLRKRAAERRCAGWLSARDLGLSGINPGQEDA